MGKLIFLSTDFPVVAVKVQERENLASHGEYQCLRLTQCQHFHSIAKYLSEHVFLSEHTVRVKNKGSNI